MGGARLPGLTARRALPVLLIEGEQGNTPPGQLAEVAAQMPNARHVRVPGTGHLVHADAPQAYRTAVEQFLAELS